MLTPYLKIIGSDGTTGTGFFASPEYIVTCKHVIENCPAGDIVSIKFDDIDTLYNAEVFRIHETADLALLKSSVPVENHYLLDRVAVPETGAVLTGYPNGSEKYDITKVEIVEQLDKSRIKLQNANDATVGYSGGPLCPEKDKNSVIGVYRGFNDRDKHGRGINTGYAIPASVVLDAWGEYVCEKRYHPQRKNLHKENDFVYQALKTDFTGRDAEMEFLNLFVQHNNSPLLWQAVVAEGGSGKSRLAYEFAHSLDSTWHCELVTQADLTVSNLNEIYKKAGRNLFLIADYAYTDTNELGDWIENILKDTPEHDIRILLLQRQGNEPNNQSKWLESLKNVNNHMFAPEITINRLSEDDIHIVMKSYAQSKGRTLDNKACGVLYEALERVDPELLRPLFAMFITDAYLEDPERPLNWNREEALGKFCGRETDAINKAVSKDCQDAAQLLTVLATITGGYSFKKRELPDFDEFEATDNIGYKLQEAGIAVKADKEYTVDAITPDILGEYFVKMYLEKHFNDIPAILDVAQKYKFLETANFLLRLFTDHEADADFIEKCCNNYLNAYYVSWGLVHRADKDKLAAIYKRSKDTEFESLLCVQYAKGLFNHFCRQTDSSEAKNLLAELKALHETAHNDKATVLYAEGLFNHFCRQTDSSEAKNLLAELKALHETAHNDEVTVWYARGLFNHLCDSTDSSEAKNLLAELKALHETAHNDEVTVEYVKGLVNYIVKFSDSSEAKNILAELKALHETAHNDEVTVGYARGLFSHFNNQTDSSEAKNLLAELKALHETAHNDEVTVEYASGLFNHLYDSTDSSEAKNLLAELKALHETAHNDEVMVEYAKGLGVYILDHAASKAEAAECLSAADSLQEESPENEELEKFCQLAHKIFDLNFGL